MIQEMNLDLDLETRIKSVLQSFSQQTRAGVDKQNKLYKDWWNWMRDARRLNVERSAKSAREGSAGDRG